MASSAAALMQTSLDTAAPAAPLAAGLSPRTVAVVGAGRTGGVGAEILRNLLDRFRGRVFPVNPKATAIAGVPCYATVSDVPAPVDLAVIAVPAARVAAAIDDCIESGVKAAVVISAGFGESGPDGRAHEATLRARVRRSGMRMIGPNCLGIVNTDPDVMLNASFSPSFPAGGSMALASQSGALGLAILDAATRLGSGMSTFVSTGNAADVSFADLLDHWRTDVRTRVILLYAESIIEPRRFAAVARQVSRTKPILALKAGRSAAGARAASSHTGALATSDTFVDALFEDAGIVRADTLEDLLATAAVLANQPLPRGSRVAILTNAGGPAILAADACAAAGLQVASLSASTTDALRAFLPPSAGVADPVDMIATASPGDYARAIPLLLGEPGVDAVIVICIPLRGTSTLDVASAVAGAARGSVKPVLATFLGAAGLAPLLSPVPCYEFPETAVRALAGAVQYARWLARPAADAADSVATVDPAIARAIVDRQLAASGGWLDAPAAESLLAAFGIPVVPTRVVVSRNGAVMAGRELGYPVVLKGAGPTLLHKTESQAVFCRLADETAMLGALATLEARRDVERILVQPMVSGGVEMFVGAVRDADFGHLVMCGSGGILLELLGDVSRRLAPVSAAAAATMLDQVRGIRRLRGFRGAAPLDEAALKDVIVRVSALLATCPEIAELDLNPVIVQERGAVVVDARIRIG
jgi:acetyl coenzyme A synthetase (ADP forming)-like protein